MSLLIWSLAIFPMAASCTKMASSLAASMPGMAVNSLPHDDGVALSNAASKTASPMTSGLNTCFEVVLRDRARK